MFSSVPTKSDTFSDVNRMGVEKNILKNKLKIRATYAYAYVYVYAMCCVRHWTFNDNSGRYFLSLGCFSHGDKLLRRCGMDTDSAVKNTFSGTCFEGNCDTLYYLSCISTHHMNTQYDIIIFIHH